MKGFLPSALKWYELTVVKASGGTLGSSSRSRSRRSIVSKQVDWVASRKIIVLAAIDAGSLSIEEACLMYRLSIEEIASWSRLTELHGIDGLKISRLGEYRKGEGISAGRSLS
jgi:hypothetical protein